MHRRGIGEDCETLVNWSLYAMFRLYISECNFHSQEDEDEIATARDIAEFEKNKHLAKPCSTLDGFSVSCNKE